MAAVATSAILEALVAAGLLVETRGTLPDSVPGLTDDSRDVRAGTLFVAVRGSVRDGHVFLGEARSHGAAVAIVEDASRTALPILVVRDGRRAAAVAASAAYGHPGKSLDAVAVTGTSGKTTTVSMLRYLLDAPEAPSASIGTLGVLLGSTGTPFPGGAGLTTPGPIELQRVLRALVDAGVRTVAMEVSSHALDQRRVEGMAFRAAVFTNLSRDHLDYHGTADEYFSAKARLVEHLTSDGVLVVNADDAVWNGLPAVLGAVRFGLTSPDADVTARDIAFSSEGSSWVLEANQHSAQVALPLVGDFNISNALGAAAAAWSLGKDVKSIAGKLSTVPQVPGRLERILDRPAVLRDYAHKPDAIERALDAVRPFVDGRLIILFGCGGDRDKGKRPIMGAIAERKADVVILTSDNPRTEDPERILDEIEAGMTRGTHVRIEDRRLAIAHALAIARPGDVVFLAGKGHETYQIRGTTSYPFDEKAIVTELSGVAHQ